MGADRSRNRERDSTGTVYCSQCGRELAPSMNYCPNCGAAIGGSTAGSRADAGTNRESGADATPTRGSVTDRDVLEHRIAAATREGWDLEHDFGDHAVMVRRTFGSLDEHLVVALVTVWFTMGIGNALYGAYRYVGDPERMVLRADHVEGTESDGAGRSALLGRATAAVCWLVAATVAVVGMYLGTTASIPLYLLAVAFAVLGTSALPSVRQRLEDRHPVSANGRVRSVDERSIVAYDRPCAACSEPVGRGIERTYRKEFCVLGVPLSASEGQNRYCHRCANGTTASVRPDSEAATERPDRTASGPDSDRAETDTEFD